MTKTTLGAIIAVVMFASLLGGLACVNHAVALKAILQSDSEILKLTLWDTYLVPVVALVVAIIRHAASSRDGALTRKTWILILVGLAIWDGFILYGPITLATESSTLETAERFLHTGHYGSLTLLAGLLGFFGARE